MNTDRYDLLSAVRAARRAYQLDSTFPTEIDPAAVHTSPMAANYVQRDGDVDVVVFRGTRALSVPAGFQDWLNVNLRASARRAGDGVVHAGFADAFASVQADVTAALRPAAPLRLVGHSMGGALALVAGAAFAAEGRAIERIISFGAPAAADREFLAGVADRVVRVEAEMDIVPLLPPQSAMVRKLLDKCGLGTAISCDFRPVGEVVYLSKTRPDGSRPSGAGVIGGLMAELLGEPRAAIGKLGAAHAVERYVALVERDCGVT